MTLTEKILARGAGKAQVQAGDNLWVNAELPHGPLLAGEQIALAYSVDQGATFVSVDAAGNAMVSSTLGAKSKSFVLSNGSSSLQSPS